MLRFATDGGVARCAGSTDALGRVKHKRREHPWVGIVTGADRREALVEEMRIDNTGATDCVEER
jgi:hypothetical protein